MYVAGGARAGVFRRWVVSVVVTAAVVGAGQVAAPGAEAATTYWVAPSGADTNPGTAAAPFATIQRCAVVMQPGDTCTINSGVYRETVRPARSGTAAAPITYRVAPNALVAVTGADEVPGWRAVTSSDLAALVARDPTLAHSEFARNGVPSGEVYVADQRLPDDIGRQLFFRGRMVVEGQYPPAGTDLLAPPIRFAAPATGGTTDTHIADPLLDKPAGYWNGARVYVSRWFAPASGTVTNYVPGSFDLAGQAGTCVPPKPYRTRYYLYGKLQAMSQRNTWFYDQTAGKLYFWTPDGQTPQGRNVEVKRRDLAFDLTAASHTVVTGVTFFGNTIRTGQSSTGVVLDSLNGRYLTHQAEVVPEPSTSCSTWTAGESTTGIVLHGTGNTLRNSELSFSSGNGVVVLGSGNTVSRNYIHDVDYLGTYAAGVNVGGAHQVVNNTIRRTGRSGINVGRHLVGATHLSGMEVGYNDVSDYDRLSADSGAIYACCDIDMSGSSFHHNWVHDARPMEAGRGESGIFLDNSMLNVLVHNNVGWNNPALTVFVNGNNDPSPGHAIYNNSGGVRLLNIKPRLPSAARTRIVNNIGPIIGTETVADDIFFDANLTAGDPLYRNPAAQDYRLQPASPARNTGVLLPWITVGYTDPNPSRGAYQYDAPRWIAGR
jgi:hypothetical protein